MRLEHINCDLCGSEEYRERYRKPDDWLRGSLFQFPVVECTSCGMVYVNPRPTEEAMASFYPVDYHDYRDRKTFISRYREQARFLPDLAGKRVLDIGCARGDFLEYLLSKSDFQAFGIDAFSDHVKDQRIRFTRGTIDEADFPSDSFDIVMAWAVFEHLHFPSLYFREVSRILKPDGQLIILVTNANSFYGYPAQREDVPRHTYHFTPDTLESYGKKHFLRLREIEFNDSIFDGRGKGTFRMMLGRWFGFQWENFVLGNLHPITRGAMKLGGAIDALVFACSWEARLRRSGIMIATYVKE